MEGKRNNNEMTDDPMYQWEKVRETQREKMKLLQEETQVHWEMIWETQRKKLKLLQEETKKILKEKDTMDTLAVAANISGDDIIEIDAGGRIIKVLRSTLTLVPDTMLSYMFSGRWKESLKFNKDGRVFIDEDSQLIEIIINFLRMKKREDPSKKKESPKIPEEKKENFASLLDYYGLTDFFYPSLDIDNIDVVQPNGSFVSLTRSKNKIQFSKKIRTDDAEFDNFDYGEFCEFYFLACKLPLDASGDGSFWKVTIDAISPNDVSGFFLGIIGNLRASYDSQSDPTSCGWAGGSNQKKPSNDFMAINGKGHRGYKYGGWSGENFIEGGCCYFHLKSNKLSMHCVQKNKTFTIDIPTTTTTVDAYHIHFNIYHPDTKITLESLNKIEWEKMM